MSVKEGTGQPSRSASPSDRAMLFGQSGRSFQPSGGARRASDEVGHSRFHDEVDGHSNALKAAKGRVLPAALAESRWRSHQEDDDHPSRLPPLAPSTRDHPSSLTLPSLPSLTDDLRDHRPLTRSRSNSLRRASSTGTFMGPPAPSRIYGAKAPAASPLAPLDKSADLQRDYSHRLSPPRQHQHQHQHLTSSLPQRHSGEREYAPPPRLPSEPFRRYSAQWESSNESASASADWPPASHPMSSRAQPIRSAHSSSTASPNAWSFYDHSRDTQPPLRPHRSEQDGLHTLAMNAGAGAGASASWKSGSGGNGNVNRGAGPGSHSSSSGASSVRSLPPLSSITSSLPSPVANLPPGSHSSGAYAHQAVDRRSSATGGLVTSQRPSPLVPSPGKKRGRGWEDLAAGERQEAIQKLLHRYIRRIVSVGVTSTDDAAAVAREEEVTDDFFVTITCGHSGVAQKSYGHEKRFLCPPPVVRIRGPGYSTPSGQTNVVHHLRMSILAAEDVGPFAHHQNQTANGQLPQVVSEDVIVDRTLQAKFGHLHVGGNTSNAKTFKLRLDMMSPFDLQPHSPGHSKMRRLSGHPSPPENFYAGISNQYGHQRTSQPPQPAMHAAPSVWLSCESDSIAVISKPSKKTTKSKTSSSQITPDLAVCLFNRVNSQNVRTKYMAVDGGQLSARNDSWTTFRMKPIAPIHAGPAGPTRLSPSSAPALDSVTYGSIVVLEAPEQGLISDPVVVCKVDKGRIIVPPIYQGQSMVNGQTSPRHASEAAGGSEGPISQMQKVAFMRYEHCAPDRAPYGQQRRPQRTFLSSSPPGPWWQSMSQKDMREAAAQTCTAEMRRPGEKNGSSVRAGRPVDGRPQTQSQSQSQGHLHYSQSQGLVDGIGSAHGTSPPGATSSTRPSLNNLAEPLAPTPLTFMPLSPVQGDNDGNVMAMPNGSSNGDIADDAFCWSVVGASHFELSFSKVGMPVESAGEAPAAEGHIGMLPTLSCPPQILPDLHVLRLEGDGLLSNSSHHQEASPGPWQVWLGGMGPLPRSPRGLGTLDAQLPTLNSLLQYCQSLYDDHEAGTADHRSRFSGSSSHAHGSSDGSIAALPTALPIVLARDLEGTICKTAYALQLYKEPGSDRDHTQRRQGLAIRIIAGP